MDVLSYNQGFITRFNQEVLNPILNAYIYDGYHKVASHLQGPLGIAIILMIVLFGVAISQGWLKLSVSALVKIVLKIALVYTFAINWDIFSQFVVAGITKGSEEIASWLIGLNPIPIKIMGGGDTSIDQALQSVLDEVMKVVQQLFQQGSWRNMGSYFMSLIVMIFSGGMVLIGFAEVVIAKIMMAILFTLAPLFIAFTLFKTTRGYFDRWLGNLVGYAFVLIFVSAILSLTLKFVDWAIADMYAQKLGLTLIGFVPEVFLGFIGICLILKVTGLALSIGGSVSTGIGSEMVAGAVGGFVGGSLAHVRAATSGLKGVGKVVGGARGFGEGLGKSVGDGASSAMRSTMKMGAQSVRFIKSKLRGGDKS